MKGGLVFPENKSSFDTFYDFLNTPNINIRYLSSGTFGIILLATIPTDSEYMRVHPEDKYGETARSLIIKLAPIKHHPRDEDRFEYEDSKSPTFEDDFVNEINVQLEIYEKTFEFGLPLCPSIVHAEMISPDADSEHYQRVTEMIKAGTHEQDTLSMLHRLFRNIRQNDFSIGIIAMEYIENSVTLSSIMMTSDDIISKTKKTTAQNAGRFALLRLAIHGYNHNDFHGGNIMLLDISRSNRKQMYLPFVIDFGRAVKLDEHVLLQIRAYIDNENPDYASALALLCKHGNEYVSDVQYNKSHYGWVCGDYGYSEEDYNKNISDIYDTLELYGEGMSMGAIRRKYPRPTMTATARKTINKGVHKISQVMQTIENGNIQYTDKYPLNHERLAALRRQLYRHFDPRQQYVPMPPPPLLVDNFLNTSSSSSSSRSSSDSSLRVSPSPDSTSYSTPYSISRSSSYGSPQTIQSSSQYVPMSMSPDNSGLRRTRSTIETPELTDLFSNIRGGKTHVNRKRTRPTIRVRKTSKKQ